MADKKISALPAATTPLAGTEVLPIVQGGVTDKVSVANLTVGRDVSAKTLTGESNGVGTPSEVIARNTAGGERIHLISRNSAGISFAQSQNSQLHIGSYDNFAVQILVNNTSKMLFDTNSDVKVQTGNLVIGTAGKGIDFSANANAPGMTSELLNWYEEGTFTPTFTGFTVGNGTVFGFYRRIGKQVFVTFGFILGSTSAVGSLTGLSGLPFTTGTVGGSRFFTVNGVAFKQGVGGFPAYSLLYSASTAGSGPASTNTNLGMNATAPFTWAADDSLSMTATYFVD